MAVPTEKRRKPRQPRRLTCEIWIDGKRQSGLVRDVSEYGIYVQTRARATTNTEAEIVFPAEKGRAELRVRARVVRLHRLTAHLATQGAGGLGFEVIRPPRGLAPLLESAGFTSGAAEPAKAAKG
jgi:hypothetical protein